MYTNYQKQILNHIHQEGDITAIEAEEIYGIQSDVFVDTIADLVSRRMLHSTHANIRDKENQLKKIYKYTFTAEGKIAWKRYRNAHK